MKPTFNSYQPNSIVRNFLDTTDKVGNREHVTENAVTTTYQPNPLNQYDSINGQTLSYDLNGNLINNNGWNYQYDAQNRLISVSNALTQASFAYDGRNRCVSRTINGNTTYLYYDDWNLIEERDVNDNLLASYVHGKKTDEIICRRVPGNTIYYHHDALGNVALLTDDSGQLIEHYAYDAFGKPTILNATNGTLQSSAYGNRFFFTGREYLPRLGLYDYRNQVYSPELGRFLQTDPIRFEGKDINLYRYTFNNPINLLDPSGTVAVLPDPGFRECSEAEWIAANQACKESHGWCYIASNCYWIKLGVRLLLVFKAGYWVQIVTCENTNEDDSK